MLDLVLLLGGLLIGILLSFFHAGRRAESWFSRVANRKTLAVLVCAGAAMLPRLALLPWLPPPVPKIHDEFSYILGAETLAAGRLTNPTPAFWQHFESFHINMVPSYQSMYPPAPSVFYALGIVAGGNPWWGVWLSTGLMCAAICWALQPIVRPRYAFLAGMACALKYGVFTIYSDSYCGGSVAALGGALTLGCFVRLVSGGRIRHVCGLGFGVALLANSRPFEGLLFAIPIALATLMWILKQRRHRVLIAATAVLAVLCAAMGYYNWRGTGNALKMPYAANFDQYHFVPPFLGMPSAPHPQYRHPQMASLYEQWEGVPGRLAQTPSGILVLTKEKFRSYYKEPFAPLLVLAIVGIFEALRSPRRRLLAYTFLLVTCGLFSIVYWPQYAYPAPLLVSLFGLGMLGIRCAGRVSVAGRRAGLYWARGLAVGLLLLGAGRMGEGVFKGLKTAVASPLPWNVARARLVDDLARRGGEHLIFIRYSPNHNMHEEWVYNSPDIDKQKVIFARMMSDTEDCRLIHYYAGRQVWILEPDAVRPPNVPYTLESSPLKPGCK